MWYFIVKLIIRKTTYLLKILTKNLEIILKAALYVILIFLIIILLGKVLS